jgi:hypothetical protein
MMSSPDVAPPCCAIRRCYSTKTFSRSSHWLALERDPNAASRLVYCFERDSDTVDWLSR